MSSALSSEDLISIVGGQAVLEHRRPASSPRGIRPSPTRLSPRLPAALHVRRQGRRWK